MLITQEPAISEPGTPNDTILCGVGRLICAWNLLEQRLEQKIGSLRQAAGDVRMIGSRTRPGMGKLLAELRAVISIRDKRDASVLSDIAAIERDIQRIDRFRNLVISGFQGAQADGFACRDHKNASTHITFGRLDSETRQLHAIGDRLLAL